MAFTSTAALLEAMHARIEALTPSVQCSEDDRFHVQIGVKTAQTGSRAVLLSAMAGTALRPGLGCHPWQTQVEITSYYNDVPTEAGQPTVMQQAIRDAEDILADLYTWASTTDGVNKIEADPAPIVEDGTGELVCIRTLRVEFQRA